MNVRDPISRLSVVVELTNNGWDPTDHPAKVLKGIELVDGSNVIASLDGGQAIAVDHYDNGLAPHIELNYEDNAVIRVCANINFGRFLYDEELALDPTKFTNLQLKVEHDYSPTCSMRRCRVFAGT